MLLFVGQIVNGPVPGGLEPGSHLPGMRKEYPIGHYLGPTGVSACVNGGGKGRDNEKTGNRESLYSATRMVRSPGKRYLGKLDDVIDQIGVWGLSMDFIYLCFPSSLLL